LRCGRRGTIVTHFHARNCTTATECHSEFHDVKNIQNYCLYSVGGHGIHNDHFNGAIDLLCINYCFPDGTEEIDFENFVHRSTFESECDVAATFAGDRGCFIIILDNQNMSKFGTCKICVE
jgi:hypothetical protein